MPLLTTFVNASTSALGAFSGSVQPPLVEIEYVLVGGGGGAGGTANNASVGGDAGRLVTGTSQIDIATITIGAGGVAGPDWSSSISSTAGGASLLNALSATGGAGSANTVCCPSNSFGGQGGQAISSNDTTVTTTGSVTPGVSNSITGSSIRFGDSHWRFSLDQTPPHQPENTGHGGWGVWSNANRRGGNGGSGRVFIKYLNSFPDLVIGTGLTYRNSAGSSVSGDNTRVAPSYTPTGFKVYEFRGGTGNITF